VVGGSANYRSDAHWVIPNESYRVITRYDSLGSPRQCDQVPQRRAWIRSSLDDDRCACLRGAYVQASPLDCVFARFSVCVMTISATISITSRLHERRVHDGGTVGNRCSTKGASYLRDGLFGVLFECGEDFTGRRSRSEQDVSVDLVYPYNLLSSRKVKRRAARAVGRDSPLVCVYNLWQQSETIIDRTGRRHGRTAEPR